MGKYRAYPEYKDSGVEWLGEVPSHWAVCSLKHLARLKSGDFITADAIEHEGSYPVFGGNGLRGFTESFTHEGHFPLIGRQGALCGNVNYAQGRFWASEHAVVAAPVKDASVIWLGELLRAMNLGQYSLSAAQPGLSVEMIANLGVPLPEIDEQTRIAAFLDRETAKIDRLIAKQEALIELLKEKRQAVISHAVTKGLDPDAPMKDSGVEWLGEIPAHWEVKRAKYFTKAFEQGWSPQCDAVVPDQDEWGVLKVGCVNGGTFNPTESKRLPRDLSPRKECLVKAGDLLISRANTRELVGSAAVVKEDSTNLMLCDKLYRLRLSSKVIPSWVSFFLGTRAARGQIELASTGASHSMQNIGQGTIKELPCPVPPRSEQETIVESLKGTARAFDAVVEKCKHQCALLQERRTALISAAVTGKIDVREEV